MADVGRCYARGDRARCLGLAEGRSKSCLNAGRPGGYNAAASLLPRMLQADVAR